MMTRANARETDIHTIESMYGIESETERRLVADLIAEMGLGVLRDYALHRLAQKHQQEEAKSL